MTEEQENTGVNEADSVNQAEAGQVPAAGESTGVTETPAAEEQGQVQESGQESEQQAVPYERFAEVNAQKNELQQQVGIYQAQLQAIMGQQPNANPQQPAAPVVADPLQGVEDYESITAGQAKAVQAQTVSQVQRMMADQRFLNEHPDYSKLVGANDPNTGIFMPAAPILQAINKNPLLANLIQNSPNPALAAYTFAKQGVEVTTSTNAPTPEQQAAAGPVMSPAAAEALARRNVPGSASQAGSTGGFNAANRIAGMTDEQFAEHKEKVKQRA